MRVVFIGKSHEFSMAPLRAIREYHHVVGIIESAPRMAKARSSSKISFFLSHWIARLIGSDSLLNTARQIKAPYMYLTRESRANLVSFLKKVGPDIICVASLSQLLPKEALGVPKYGAVNLHPSMLPKYHGPYPWFWQYYSFERECGITVHSIDEGQDTGPIIKQASFTLEMGTDIVDAMKMVAPLGARLMLEAVNEIGAGQAVFRPQPSHNYPKARIVDHDEKLIDWQGWPIERVWHFMRGTYPWLDAGEYPKGIRGTWKIGAFERYACEDTPGKVCKDGKGYYVAHKEGKVRLYLNRSMVGRLKGAFSKFIGS